MDVKLCRLCAIKKDSFVGVYDDEGHKLRIESKINKCLQIEVGLGVVVKAYYFFVILAACKPIMDILNYICMES